MSRPAPIVDGPVEAPLLHRNAPAGSWPVMLTPFDDRRRIDWAAFDALVEWYVAAGSQGLFAVCLSSELFQLTPAERLKLGARAVSVAAGRLPVIVAGALGNTPAEIAAAAQRLADTGADAVVFLSNQFSEHDESDDVWRAAAEETLSRLDPTVPLGLYECPIPYKRVLSPRIVRWAAETARFGFLKDTCCDLAMIEAKLAALAGTDLRFFNAHTATLLPSLSAGGHGFSGVGANVIPHLYAWLCRHHAEQPELAAELQNFFITSSPAVDIRYPHSAKAYLGLQGLPITPVCRLSENPLDSHDEQRLRRFHEEVVLWERRLGLDSPFSLRRRGRS